MQVLSDVAQAQLEFERWLERQPLADRTKREYARNVRVLLGSSSGMRNGRAMRLADTVGSSHSRTLAGRAMAVTAACGRVR